jgi:hypothetical protein
MFIIAPLVAGFRLFYWNAAMSSGQCWNGKNPERAGRAGLREHGSPFLIETPGGTMPV